MWGATSSAADAFTSTSSQAVYLRSDCRNRMSWLFECWIIWTVHRQALSSAHKLWVGMVGQSIPFPVISVTPGHQCIGAKDVASCMLTPRVPPSREPRADCRIDAKSLPCFDRRPHHPKRGPTRSHKVQNTTKHHKTTISKIPAGYFILVCFQSRAWEVARHLRWSALENTKSVYKLSICFELREMINFLLFII